VKEGKRKFPIGYWIFFLWWLNPNTTNWTWTQL